MKKKLITTIYTDPDDRLKQIGDYTIPAYFIFPPKLLMQIEGFDGDDKHWHFLVDLIGNNLRNAKLSYAHRLVEGCIFYSIRALEYSLKAKYCLYLADKKNPEEADQWLLNRNASLGDFLNERSNKLVELKLEKIKDRLEKLNNLRNGLFHFNYKKIMQGIKDLGWDYSDFETESSWIIYPNLIDDSLAINVFTLVTELLDIIFSIKRK